MLNKNVNLSFCWVKEYRGISIWYYCNRCCNTLYPLMDLFPLKCVSIDVKSIIRCRYNDSKSSICIEKNTDNSKKLCRENKSSITDLLSKPLLFYLKYVEKIYFLLS